MAVAHSMVVAAWHMLSTGEPYNDPGSDYFATRLDRQRHTKRLTHQLEQLGYIVTLTTAA